MRVCLLRLGLMVGLMGIIVGAHALDVTTYRQMAEDALRQVRMGVVGDIDAMIRVQEQLMEMGVSAGVEYLKQSRAKEGRALQLVIVNAENMKELSLDKIELLWHQGKFLKKKGIDFDGLDHLGEMSRLMEAIIHPATAYIALNEYKQSGNSQLLARVQAELIEVIEHVQQIGVPTQSTVN